MIDGDGFLVFTADVTAPPELSTFIAGTDGPDEGADGEGESFDDVEAVGTDGPASTVEPAAAFACVPSDEVDAPSADAVSSARAMPIPWPEATAAPTPNATASAPTRPM